MTAYYNENDPFAAQWLRNLIEAGHIAPGDVDARSIVDVCADDLRGYAQCHFFAGIGGWSYALRLAGWPDDHPVWTGSCPCQPFSAAGKRKGTDDPRHLWPEFHCLIAECHPSVVFGEQIAAKAGREWLAGVRADLEDVGYAVGAADLCAAGVAAPHIRQRLYWVADAERGARQLHGQQMAGTASGTESSAQERQRVRADVGDVEQFGGVADDVGTRLEERPSQQRDDGSECETAERGSGSVLRVAQPDGGIEGDGDLQRGGEYGQQPQDSRPGGVVKPQEQQHNGAGDPWRGRREPANGSGLVDAESEQVGRTGQPWCDGVWLECTDGKARRIEPGSFPLAHGVPARVGRLRGYGNAIVPQVAAEFISAYIES